MLTRTAIATVVVVVAALLAGSAGAALAGPAGAELAGPAGAAQASEPTLELPEAPGGWVLRIRTSGGIMGQGVGDIALASDGRLLCLWQSARCGPAVAGEAMRAMLDQVRRASAATWLVFQAETLCRDCVTTVLVLTSRNADGTLTTMRAAWDPTTRARLPGDVTRLHDMTVSLRR